MLLIRDVKQVIVLLFGKMQSIEVVFAVGDDVVIVRTAAFAEREVINRKRDCQAAAIEELQAGLAWERFCLLNVLRI